MPRPTQKAELIAKTRGEVDGWRPIESAPKDQPVLVWFDHDADPYRDPANPDLLPAKLHNIIRKFGTTHAECRRRAIFPRLGGDALSQTFDDTTSRNANRDGLALPDCPFIHASEVTDV